MTSTDFPSTPAGAPKLHALVPCAGVGERAGAGQPKQYVSVAGVPLVFHTLKALAQVTRLDAITVVLSPQDRWFESQVSHSIGKPIRLCPKGGATRAASVHAGLVALRDAGAHTQDWVLVHDAARCLVTPEAVNRLIDACLHDTVGGLLAMPMADTLKTSSDERSMQTLDRRDKWTAQTPQMFRLGVLIDALERAGDTVTDEASAIEALGLYPRLVRGDLMNFKVTWPEELALAARWLNTLVPEGSAPQPGERP